MDYKVEFISVNSLKPYEKNAKTHPQEQIDRIAESIKQLGFKQNLVVDKDNNVVIGHGRLLAAKQLGIESVPCIKADDLTDEQIKALRLVDNKVAESEWDIDLLDLELGEIQDLNMSDFGFSMTDMEFMDFEEAERIEHSKRMNSTIVSVIIGAAKFEIDDKTHNIYDATRRVNPEKAGARLTELLLNGELE